MNSTAPIVVSLAALFVVPACTKDSPEAPAAAQAAEASKPTPQGGGTPAAPTPRDLAVFPAETSVIASFSLAELRTSTLWAQLVPLVQGSFDEEVAELKAACGFDPLDKFGSLVVGGRPGHDETAIVLIKGFTRAEFVTCGAALARADGDAWAVSEQGDLIKLRTAGHEAFVVFLDDTTVMLSMNPDPAWVKARAAGQGGLDGVAGFMDLYRSIDRSADFWMVMRSVPGGDMDIAEDLPGARGLFVSLTVSDVIAIDGAMRFDGADAAQAAHGLAMAQLGQVKPMLPPAIKSVLDRTAIASRGNDLAVSVKLTAADLIALDLAPTY